MRIGSFLRDNAAWLAAGFLLTFTSSYGQTFFISLFAGELRATFGLTNGQWGGLYTLATTASAVVMVWAGTLTDRYRVRALGRYVLVGLALACVAMAAVPNAFALVLVIFALRFTGQGMTNHIAVVAMARWFSATRGKALAISRLGYTTGEAFLPMIFVALLGLFHWRALWLVAAGGALLAIPLLTALLRRERIPSEMSSGEASAGMGGRHWTRHDVLHHRLFWLAAPLMIGPPAFGTALFFHQVHMVEVKGWDLIDYVALFPLFSGVSFLSMLASGLAVDRFGSARLISWIVLPYVAGFMLMAQAQSLAPAAVALALLGLTNGTMGTVAPSFWAEFYGTRHIGAIKAMVAAQMVFGTAIGPGLTGFLIDLGFDFPSQMTAIGVYFIIATALIAFGVASVRRDISAN
ncbi:MAG: MFS transporter [Maritimibacter sp.]|nr:MFS transporter [Maritimibacter sp.]